VFINYSIRNIYKNKYEFLILLWKFIMNYVIIASIKESRRI